MFISSQVDVVALFLRSEVHFEPIFFQRLVVVGPTRFQVFVPALVGVNLFCFVQPSQIFDFKISGV